MENNKIKVFDTTLRDGEQSPGCSMNLEEKLKVFETLQSLNVDIVEAGFAIASEGDFEAVKEVSKLAKNTIVCSLARSNKDDIERANEALSLAARFRIHTFIATSELHMKYKLQMTKEEVIQQIKDSVSYARNFTDDVEWSAEDGSRSDFDFLCKCIDTAIKSFDDAYAKLTLIYKYILEFSSNKNIEFQKVLEKNINQWVEDIEGSKAYSVLIEIFGIGYENSEKIPSFFDIFKGIPLSLSLIHI